ncbi:competence/damage-inducible protein A [Oleispirillum naphthae]|uniref:competence/damage-inducible protein A n=1 Tax=Oleispirillum naphthae TaxID=2838853 RepID=UPI0030822227
MPETNPTACVIIIGNEILSGRIKDENLPYLAAALAARGIPVKEARVIPDVEADIVAAVNAVRSRYTYVFTTGGIGPTHDDITAASVAAAFGVPCSRHPEAEKILTAYYGAEANAARMRMADTPQGASLIPNPVSAAPGFRIGNVHVLAGVPRIMQAMFDGIAHTLDGGAPVLSRAVSATAREGDIAETLSAIQESFPTVDLGSYPFGLGDRIGTCVVGRSTDRSQLDAAIDAVAEMFRNAGLDPSFTDPMAALQGE